MDKNNLVKTIISEIKEIETLVIDIQKITAETGDINIHQIDIDLGLSRIRDLYEKFLELKTINTVTGATPDDSIVAEGSGGGEISEEEVVSETISEPETTEHQPEIEEKIPEDEKSSPTLFNQKLLDFNKEASAEEPVDKTEKASEAKDDKIKTVGDKYSDARQSVNDILARNKKENNLAAKLQYTPISDLRSSIGINDRFKYINDLFDGNSDSFDQAIGRLNDLNNLNEAMEYISQNFEWDEENDSFKTLLKMIYRRFAVLNEEKQQITSTK